MARKGSNSANPPTPAAPPPMTEDQAKGEKDSVAAAFDQAGPGPGANVKSTKEDPTAPPKTVGTLIPTEGPTQYVGGLEDGENLPTFQQIFRRPLTDHDLAERFKAAGILKKEKDEVELAKKKSNDAFTKKINQLDAQIDAHLIQANAGADEKELTCRKRIDWDRGIATTFDANTLEILERRQLNLKEIQVEMRWAGKVPPGKQGDVVAGPWKTTADETPRHAPAAPEAPAPVTAPAEGEAAAEGAPAPANPVDNFTLPASEVENQSGRRRGRPPKAKPGEEAQAAAPAGGLEAEFEAAGAAE